MVVRAKAGDPLQNRSAGNAAIEEKVENAGVGWNAVVRRPSLT